MGHYSRFLGLCATATLGAAMLAACGSSSNTATSPVTPSAQPTGSAKMTTPTPTNSNTGAPPTKEINQPGDIPDNQVFVPWTAPSGDYSITVPEGWARSKTAGATTFTDKLNSITAVEQSGPKPTVASVTADVKQIKKSSTGWVDGTVSQITRTSGPAILATYQADVPADPVTNKVINDDVEQYTFWKSGNVVTLTLAGPHGADNVDPWRIVTDSFKWQ